MQLTNAIIHDVLAYFHLSRVVMRYRAQGKPLEPYEQAAYVNCKNRLYAFYVLTGFNAMTACDQDLAVELLHTPTIIAVAYIPTRNICYLAFMSFAVGLFYDTDGDGYRARYCYHTLAEAREAFNTWSGEGHPPGNWIIREGDGDDIINPNYKRTTNYTS